MGGGGGGWPVKFPFTEHNTYSLLSKRLAYLDKYKTTSPSFLLVISFHFFKIQAIEAGLEVDMEPFAITMRETEAVAAAIWDPPINSDVSLLRQTEVLPSFSTPLWFWISLSSTV
jgi:hypothetical protein